MRRAIAETLGWRCEVTEGGGRKFTRPGQSPLYAKRSPEFAEKMFWEETPDWPNDDGAAFLLACDVAEKYRLHLVVDMYADPPKVQYWEASEDGSLKTLLSSHEFKTPESRAYAIARLALSGMLRGNWIDANGKNYEDSLPFQNPE
jgi:hypothetical protein